MKKILLVVLIITLLFSCSGCYETPEISFPSTTFYFNEEFNMRIFGLSGGILTTMDNKEMCFEIMNIGYPYDLTFFKVDNLRSTSTNGIFEKDNFLFGATGRIDDEENLILELNEKDIGNFLPKKLRRSSSLKRAIRNWI